MSTLPSLLDPAFLRELEALRRRLEIRARSGAAGEHTARRRGGSAEFHEHRPYTSGDDLRRVDWLAFARTGSPVVKLFRSEEDAVMRLLIDASASLDYGEPNKLDVARRLAAAFAYLALAGSQRAQLLVARSGDDKSAAEAQSEGLALARVGVPRRGRAGLPLLLRELSAVQAAGGGNLARAIDEAVRRSARPGLLVVLSDFLDPGPVTTALGRARAAGHDLSLVHILSRDEIEPRLEGDYSLVDAETGAAVEVTMDARALEAYMARLSGLVEELRAFARRHAVTYLSVVTDEPLEGVVRRFVARAID